MRITFGTQVKSALIEILLHFVFCQLSDKDRRRTVENPVVLSFLPQTSVISKRQRRVLCYILSLSSYSNWAICIHCWCLGELKAQTTNLKLNDNKWHKVNLTRVDRDVTITIDDGLASCKYTQLIYIFLYNLTLYYDCENDDDDDDNDNDISFLTPFCIDSMRPIRLLLTSSQNKSRHYGFDTPSPAPLVIPRNNKGSISYLQRKERSQEVIFSWALTREYVSPRYIESNLQNCFNVF